MVLQAAEFEAPSRPPTDIEFIVLALHAMDWKNVDIAGKVGLDPSTVSKWIKRAYDRGYFDKLPNPREFGLRLECRCKDAPIPNGEPIVCVLCTMSGFDFHPKMSAPPLPPERTKHKAGALKGGV